MLLLLNWLTDMSRHLTLSQHNSFISWELCLDWLWRKILSALPQVPLWTAKTTEPPEVSPVSTCCFGESVLHTGELLCSVDKSRDTVIRTNINTASTQRHHTHTNMEINYNPKGDEKGCFHLFLLGMMPLSTSWWFLPMRIASQEPNLPL